MSCTVSFCLAKYLKLRVIYGWKETSLDLFTPLPFAYMPKPDVPHRLFNSLLLLILDASIELSLFFFFKASSLAVANMSLFKFITGGRSIHIIALPLSMIPWSICSDKMLIRLVTAIEDILNFARTHCLLCYRNAQWFQGNSVKVRSSFATFGTASYHIYDVRSISNSAVLLQWRML